MLKLTKAEVLNNVQIAPNIYDMWLKSPEITKNAKAGQFINVYIDKGEHILPRPISICEIYGDNLRIVYHIVGGGTEYISSKTEGNTIKISGPVGNGFNPGKEKKVALIGGGIGLPPLLELAKVLKSTATDIKVFAGFRNKEVVILQENFINLGIEYYISTDDGSLAYHGNAVDCFKITNFSPDIIYACGPTVMLKAVAKLGIPSKLSLEERMACGFGACVGCAVKVKEENAQGWAYKKVCQNGPVFLGDEVIFDE